MLYKLQLLCGFVHGSRNQKRRCCEVLVVLDVFPFLVGVLIQCQNFGWMRSKMNGRRTDFCSRCTERNRLKALLACAMLKAVTSWACNISLTQA